MSTDEFAQMKKRYRLSRNRSHNERVERVGRRLSRVVFWDMPNADWEFVVFDSPEVNAFAMPGGKVGVFAGLFKIATNDDQLAAVLAHEIAHVTAKHAHERLTRAMAGQIVGLGVGALATVQTGSIYAGGNAMQGASILTGLAGIPFDRKKELEADHIGLIYMARAGYNPEEAIKVFENLEAESASRPAPWFSTHPSHPQRIIQIMDLMPEALEIYRNPQTQAAPIIVK